MALCCQKQLHKEFTSDVDSMSLEGAMAETVSYFCLSWRSSWLHPYTSMAQTQICPSAVITDTFGFTQAFPSFAQSCSVGPCGANASTFLSQQIRNCMHVKDTNKGSEGVLWFPVLVGVRVTQCMFIWSTRNSREDLQIWTSALSNRKGREALAY